MSTAPQAPGHLPRDTWLEVVRNAPLVSMDLIVRDAQRRVLLGLRRNEPARGFWFVPGGTIRKNERLDAAFSRVAQDELGLQATRAQVLLLGVCEHLYDDNFAQASGFGTHYVVLAYELSVPQKFAPPPDQHHDWRWASVAELLGDDTVHEYCKAYFHDPHP